jgi:hypothetical protein
MTFECLAQREAGGSRILEIKLNLIGALPNTIPSHWFSSFVHHLRFKLITFGLSQPPNFVFILNVTECNCDPLSFIAREKEFLIHFAVDGTHHVGITHDQFDVFILAMHLFGIVFVDEKGFKNFVVQLQEVE